jgi:pyruvate dehydrogenase E1 component alpha subunit
MAVPHVADRAKGYGIPAGIVDGNDALAVYAAAKAAAERARTGGGPTLIECKTMRMRGHAEHDDAFYVPPRLLEEWRAKDPIQRLERTLREAAVLTDAEEQRIAERIGREVEDAVQFAEQSPLPDGGGVTQGVYAV